jgi:ribonuclease P protein component, eubacterial
MAFARAWPPVLVARCWPVAAPRAASVSRFKSVDCSGARIRSTLDLPAPARRFQPAQRLRHKSEFDRVYRDSRRSTDACFAVLTRNSGGSIPRLGLSIAARIIGNAVRRNRIKRLVRESFRQHQHELPAVDIVVNARSGARDADNAVIARSLEKHWRTVVKQCAQ